MSYVVVRNWERFQHYRDRTPPWIKTYLELMSDDAYLGLTGHRRAVLHGLWMEYARARRRLPDDTATISRRLALKVTTSDLEALNHAGFIEVGASTPLAPRAHAKRKRRDKDKGRSEEAKQGVPKNGERPEFDIDKIRVRDMPP